MGSDDNPAYSRLSDRVQNGLVVKTRVSGSHSLGQLTFSPD